MTSVRLAGGTGENRDHSCIHVSHATQSLRAAARKNQAGWSWVEVVHGAVRRLGWNEPHS